MLSRRELLAVLGTGASAAALAPWLGGCGASSARRDELPVVAPLVPEKELHQAYALAAATLDAPFLWARARQRRIVWRDSSEQRFDHESRYCVVVGGMRDGERVDLRLIDPAPGELLALTTRALGSTAAKATTAPLVKAESNRRSISDAELSEHCKTLHTEAQRHGDSQIIFRSVFCSDEDDESLYLNEERHLQQRTGRSRVGALVCAWTGKALRYETADQGGIASAKTLPFGANELAALTDGALSQLHARRCSPGHYDLLFSPASCAVLLHELLSQGFCDEGHGQAQPIWTGTLLPELLQLSDDPMQEAAFGSYQRDERGALAPKQGLTDAGLLLRERIGHDLRDERGAPQRALANVQMASGAHSENELVAMCKKGLWLDRVDQVDVDESGNRVRLLVPRARELLEGRSTGRVLGPLIVSAPIAELLASVRGAGRRGQLLCFERKGTASTVLARSLLSWGHAVPHGGA